MNPSSMSSTRIWAAMALVLVLAALLFFPRLGNRSLWGSEGRWAEVAREMGQSGNYFWPTINGEVYYDKPLLSYWFVAAAGTLTGHLNETATRLPSAVAGLAGVLLVMLLAGKLYDRRTALFSGVILATGYSYVFHARLASAEMESLVGVLAVLTLFMYHEHPHEQGPTGWWVVGLWLLMAVTSLTKGLIGFALPLFILGCDSLFSDGWRTLRERIMRGPLPARAAWLIERGRWLLNWKTVPALAAAGLVYVLPFVISSVRMHSEAGLMMVVRENIIRFFEPFDHRGPIYLYAYMIFLLAAPWSLFLPAALVRIHTAPPSRPDRFVLVYFWATFLFFTLSGSRRSYYLIPILPGVALLLARLFAVGWTTLSRHVRGLTQAGFLLVAIVIVAAGIAVLLPDTARPKALAALPPFPARGVFVLLWGVELAVLIAGFRAWRRGAFVWPTAVIASCGLLFYFVFALPAIEQYRGEKPFARTVRATLHGDWSHLVLYKVKGAAGLLFYLRTESSVPEYRDREAMAKLIETTPNLVMIAPSAESEALSKPGAVLLREQAFPWEKPGEQRSKLVLWAATPASISPRALP
jgi:4-amino-4-deoxy-L-arabinose transferase-like glycosyltransferase